MIDPKLLTPEKLAAEWVESMRRELPDERWKELEGW